LYLAIVSARAATEPTVEDQNVSELLAIVSARAATEPTVEDQNVSELQRIEFGIDWL
jgi:hypothetical protein